MKTLFKAGSLLALLALLLIMGGCSDDDETTNPADKRVGDVSDPEFVRMNDAIDEMEGFGDEMLSFMFLAVDTVWSQIPGRSPHRPYRQFQAAGVEADSIYLTYHPTSQYWYLYFRGEEASEVDTVTVMVMDSIQFFHATGPVQWPDSALLVGINNGILLSIESSLGNVISANQRVTVTGELATQGDVVLDGTQGFDVFLIGPLGGCTLDLDMGTTATSVGLNIAHTDLGGCPDTGVMRHAGTIAISCVGPPPSTYNDTWLIVMTFTGDDGYTIVAENTTTRWTTSGTCLGEGL